MRALDRVGRRRDQGFSVQCERIFWLSGGLLGDGWCLEPVASS